MAANLSRNDMLVMVVKGLGNNPEFVFPGDALLLPPGLGRFSCCEVDHDFGSGIVKCDRVAVRNVLGRLLKAKINYHKERKEWFSMRYFASLEHHFCQGLEVVTRKRDRRGSFESFSKKTFCSKLVRHKPVKIGSARLQAFRTVLGWRDDAVEREETRATGASLLFWAAAANDLPVVNELLRNSSNAVNQGIVKTYPELIIFAKMTPLIAAMSFGRWKISKLLLDAGADPKAKDGIGNDCLFYSATMGRTENVSCFLSRFTEHDLERRNKLHMSACEMTLMFGNNQQQHTIDSLLRFGARMPSLPLHFAAANIDSNPAMLNSLLTKVGQGKGGLSRKLNLQNYPRSILWKNMHRIARARVYFGSNNRLVEAFAWQHGATPLHYAIAFGNLSTARLLAGAGARQDIKNAQGLKAADLSRKIYGDEQGAMMHRLIRLEGQRRTLRESQGRMSARADDVS